METVLRVVELLFHVAQLCLDVRGTGADAREQSDRLVDVEALAQEIPETSGRIHRNIIEPIQLIALAGVPT